jgi:dihydrofolate reductase
MTTTRRTNPVKLTTMTQVTVDGVMQGNGGATDEDRRNGFERGGWARGAGDDETLTFINQTYRHADAFPFGRRTYELFAGYWGAEGRARAAAEDPARHPIAAALNSKPKYVATTALTGPLWPNTTVLSGDLAAALAELKAGPGGELQVHGSGSLVRWLLANDLVDEITLLVVPVVLGQGARLFPQDGPDIALDLVESRADSRGRHDPGLQAERAPAIPGPKRVTRLLDRLVLVRARRVFGRHGRLACRLRIPRGLLALLLASAFLPQCLFTPELLERLALSLLRDLDSPFRSDPRAAPGSMNPLVSARCSARC